MESESYQTPFSKAIITSVFVGFFCTVLCLLYNIFYREETGLVPAAIINVSSLIFVVNLVFLVIGILYSVFRSLFKRGDILFVIVFALLTILFGWMAEGVTRSADPTVTLQFRGLLLGIILIMGLSATFAIPFLFHNRQFNRNVL
jgi:hypothetical protein